MIDGILKVVFVLVFHKNVAVKYHCVFLYGDMIGDMYIYIYVYIWYMIWYGLICYDMYVCLFRCFYVHKLAWINESMEMISYSYHHCMRNAVLFEACPVSYAAHDLEKTMKNGWKRPQVLYILGHCASLDCVFGSGLLGQHLQRLRQCYAHHHPGQWFRLVAHQSGNLLKMNEWTKNEMWVSESSN